MKSKRVCGVSVLALMALLLGCGGGGGSQSDGGGDEVAAADRTGIDAVTADRGGTDVPTGDVAAMELPREAAQEEVEAGETGPSDLGTPDVTVPPAPFLAPPALVLQPFTVVLESDTSLAVAGQEVLLHARVARGVAQGEVTFTWSLDGAPSEGLSGTDVAVAFAEAGLHVVSVQAVDGDGGSAEGGAALAVVAQAGPFAVGDADGNTVVESFDAEIAQQQAEGEAPLSPGVFEAADVDLDGRVTGLDVELIQSAADAGADAPSHLSHETAGLGARLLWIHPALLDPETQVEVRFGDGPVVVPVRGRPGYAAFVVPPDAVPGALTLSLLVDAAAVASEPFEVLPFPEPLQPGDPGAGVVQALDELDGLLNDFPDLVGKYADALGASADERAVLLGMLEVARGTLSAHREAFLGAFAQMEPEGRAAFEAVARANGLDQALADLALARGELDRQQDDLDGLDMTPEQAGTIISLVCLARQVTDISAKVAEINEIASGYLAWFDWYPLKLVPVVGQVITFLGNISAAMASVTDIVGLVAEYLPELGSVGVEVTPADLDVGASATVQPYVVLVLATKLCGAAANAAIGTLMEQMTSLLVRRLGGSIPLLGSAFHAVQFDREKMSTVVGLCYDAIHGIAGKVLDALGVRSLLQSLAERLCSLLQDPTLPLPPDTVQPSCGGMSGTSWPCVEQCQGAVAFTAGATLCGQAKSGSAGVQCGECSPQCDDKACGPDGCGGECGTCYEGESCQVGACVPGAPCPGSGVAKWAVGYNAGGAGTWMFKDGADPLGTYTSLCYGVPQYCTVTIGPEPNTYVIQAEEKCFSFPVDETKNCIYCESCPAGTAVTAGYQGNFWWAGMCGDYYVSLNAVCNE